MSENEGVIRAMLELANRHDGAAIHAYLSEAMQRVDPAIGASAASRMHAVQSALISGFPDLEYRMDRLTVSGETVVVECTLSGTHQGVFAGVAPTNRRIELPAAFCVEIADGKLKECRSYFDTLTLMEQLGAIPAPGAAAVPEATRRR
jgi:steroid delta-isomerase-like uncharacterized protein